MEFKGTKGPWKIHKQAFCCIVSDDSKILVANCGGRTSNVNSDELIKEQEANTVLISKSPDILNELKETVIDLGILRNQISKENQYGLSHRWEGMAELIDNWIERKNKLIKESTTI